MAAAWGCGTQGLLSQPITGNQSVKTPLCSRKVAPRQRSPPVTQVTQVNAYGVNHLHAVFLSAAARAGAVRGCCQNSTGCGHTSGHIPCQGW